MPVPAATSPLDFLHQAAFTVPEYGGALRGAQVTWMALLVIAGVVVFFLVRLLSPGGGGQSCKARHILMKSKEDLMRAKTRIEGGEDFSTVAKECSSCPSAKSGGSLGTFAPGQMVPAFDKVCFSPDTKIGEVVGPVQTHFGYHLIIVDERQGVAEQQQKEE